MKVLAHRGLCTGAPENTLAAFEAAARAGVDGIETDVRCTADGVLVLVHDRHLPGGRPVAQARLAELAAALAPAPACTVAEALATFPHLLWNLELKDGRAGPALVRLLRQQHPRLEAVLSSFDHRALSALDSVPWRRGALLAHRPARLAEEARRLRQQGFDLLVQAHEHLVGDDLHGAAGHLPLWAYDPQGPEEHAALAGWPLEAVITDQPGQLPPAARPAH
ncbi:MAG: glycerophosphodiester phosphodiesterase [Planctomycetia bacterium]